MGHDVGKDAEVGGVVIGSVAVHEDIFAILIAILRVPFAVTMKIEIDEERDFAGEPLGQLLHGIGARMHELGINWP